MTTIWILLALMVGACAGFLLAACVMLLIEARQDHTETVAPFRHDGQGFQTARLSR
jgi:hypothetical protein